VGRSGVEVPRRGRGHDLWEADGCDASDLVYSVEQGIESARDVANALGVNGPPHGNLHFGEGASLLRLMKTR